jgi:hypothetical protein
MMDINDIDNALHEIKQMALIAIGAAEHLISDNTEPRIFHLSERDTDMLSFSIFDILRRVGELKDGLDRSTATIVRIAGNDCA